ncbi:ATP-binding protein [Asanoa siamensis]|uniref:LuxR family transcriptional regulator n=1 Tax=Asanoa siamensis TaxID=926357 RepID=A0ABQ4CNZ6_9ACTN|nr:AAA family ATPase [Asanoa siamensis]GIF73000.1 LuxR family transcriptional regulator [Asanoa siamensis]
MLAGESVFVGRANELATLQRRLSEVRLGTARTVLVGGRLGVGKSQLLSRFAVEARQSGAQVLSGACEPHFGNPMPYGPLLEVLETFGRAHGARAADLGGPAYTKLSAFFDLESDATWTPHHVFLAVRRMLEHIGARAPVVLIIEDLHWADPSTLDLVRHLAQADPDGRPLLLVASYRPPLRDDPLWQLFAGTTFLRRTERFELPVFESAEIRGLIAATVAGRVDPRLVERCLLWSGGVPLFAEQLITNGALTGGDDDIEVPPDLRSVMLAPLRELGPDARKVLRVAAVAGRAMSRRLLGAVSGLPAETLGDALQECADRQLLVARRGEDVYRFAHVLLREAVYEDTVPDTRVRLHVAMAEALAADPRLCVTEGSAAAEQANHWYQAGSWPQALTFAVQAGRAAARTLAFGSAKAQFDRALELWPTVDDAEGRAGVSRSRLLADAAEAARWSRQVGRAVTLVEEAIAAADDGRLGELQERRATYLWEAGRRAESVAAFQEADALLAGSPPSAVHARVLAALALARMQNGQYVEGGRIAEAALAMATEVAAEAERGRALNVSGLGLGMRREPGGEERLRAALDIARSVNHIEDLLRAYGNLGLILEEAGRLRESAEVTTEGLAEARRLGLADTRQGTILANNSSAALVLLGDWEDAEKIITEVTLDHPVAESLYPRLTLAEIKVGRGDYAQAGKLLASIDEVPLPADPRFVGPLHVVRAELALAAGDLARAADEVLRGVDAVSGGENALELLRLCAVGMRCAADWAATEPGRAAGLGDRLANAAWAPGQRPSTDEVRRIVELCAVERQRIRGADTAPGWKVVADGWAALDRPYPAAYARWRQARAAYAAGDRDGAREPARNAYRAATSLDAGPLRDRVHALAGKLGMDLADRPVSALRPYGLAAVEFETLRLLYEGKNAAEIATVRGVSRRTVETQFRKVYAKLDVHKAIEAIARARDEKLFG